MIDRRTLIGAAAAVPLAGSAIAQGDATTPWPPAEHLKLWPGRPPGSPVILPVPAPSMNGRPAARELWLRGIAEPVIGIYRPAKPDGRAVLAIPGGGYGFVSVQNEGIDVGRVLNPAGITVFALAYRLPAEGWVNRADVPLQDAQRAMRLIRANAGRYGVDPKRVAVLGFSAGGHLAASLTVGHGDAVYTPVDAADALSARPDASGLVYPVTSLATATTHRGSTDNLLGPAPAPALIARYNTPARVSAATPPLFIVHAFDDATVPIEQSFELIAAARAGKVPVEAHLFELGGHGFGAMHSPADSARRLWPDLFTRWLGEHFAGTAA